MQSVTLALQLLTISIRRNVRAAWRKPRAIPQTIVALLTTFTRRNDESGWQGSMPDADAYRLASLGEERIRKRI
jgi:hypothetical protein